MPAEARLCRQELPPLPANAFDPSLRFKPIGKPNWSARVSDRYRAVGKFSGSVFLWEWIGTHEDYNKRFWVVNQSGKPAFPEREEWLPPIIVEVAKRRVVAAGALDAQAVGLIFDIGN